MFAPCLLALALIPTTDPKPRLDPDGLPLPAEAVQRFGSQRFLVNHLKAAAFSPDGKTVYTISDEDPTGEHYDPTNPGLIAWEVPTGKKLWEVAADTRLEQVAADPDGKGVWVLQHVERKNAAYIWERVRYSTKEGRELSRFRFEVDATRQPLLHAGGAIAAVEPGEDHKGYRLTVWDRGGGRVAQQAFPTLVYRPGFSVMWSPGGDRLFFQVGEDPESRGYGAAFDVAKAKVLWEVETKAGFVWQVSPDAKWLVGFLRGPKKADSFLPWGDPATVHRWNADTGKEDAALAVKDMPLSGQFDWSNLNPDFRFIPNSNFLLLMIDRWKYVGVDWRKWEAVKTPLKRAWNAVYSPDGKTYCVGSGRHLVVHDTTTGRQLSPAPPEFSRWAHRLTVSPTADRLIRRAHGGPEIQWALSTGREVSRIGWDKIAPLIGTERGTRSHGPDCNPDGVCLSPDGTRRMIQVRENDRWHGEVTNVAQPKDPPVRLTMGWSPEEPYYDEFCFTPDARWLVGLTAHKGLHVWDATRGGRPKEGRFEPWDWQNHNPCHTSEFASYPNPDSRAVAVVERHAKPVVERDEDAQAFWRVGVYTVPDAKLLHRFDGVGELTAFGWTHDGRVVGVANRSLFATPEPGKFDLLCLDPHTKRMRVHQIDPDVRCWAVAPVGDMVAVGSSDGLRLYEAGTGKVRHRFREQTRPVQVVAFSPDGRYLAAESVDGPLLLWDVRGDLSKPAKPDAAGWDAAWAALGGEDAAKAFRAVRLFALHPDNGAAELKRRFAERKPPSAEVVAALVRQLDDRDYATRERATKELRELGFAAFPALKKALADNPPEELRARAERLLAATTSPDVRRAERAVEAMQLADTEAARKLIAEWAKGPADDVLTKAAKQAR